MLLAIALHNHRPLGQLLVTRALRGFERSSAQVNTVSRVATSTLHSLSPHAPCTPPLYADTDALVKAAGPGRWNDPDMLLIGANVTTKPAQRGQPPLSSQTPCLSSAEERTQMAIWAIIAAPLIMGNDARSIKPSSAAILLNRHAIEIDQDELGRQGGRLDEHSASTPQQVWWRPLSGGDVAVGLYNKDPEGVGAAKVAVRFADVGLAGKCVSVLEVWSGAVLNCTTAPTYTATVDHHDTLLLRLTPHAP